MTSINVGQLVKEELRRQKHNADWLAEQLHCDRSNVYHIFHRNDISTELLRNISRVLKHDFFQDLSQDFSRQEQQTQG